MTLQTGSEEYDGIGGGVMSEELAALPRLVASLGVPLSPIAKPSLALEEEDDLLGNEVAKRDGGHASLNGNEVSLGKGSGGSTGFLESLAEENNEHIFVNESAVWRQIESSLSLPAIYRRKEELSLTLRMLSRVPFLKRLNKEELLTVANGMKILSFPTSGCIAWEKALYTGGILGIGCEGGGEKEEIRCSKVGRSSREEGSIRMLSQMSEEQEDPPEGVGSSGGRKALRGRSGSVGGTRLRDTKKRVSASSAEKIRPSSRSGHKGSLDRVDGMGLQHHGTSSTSESNSRQSTTALRSLVQVMRTSPVEKRVDAGTGEHTLHECSSFSEASRPLRPGSDYKRTVSASVSGRRGSTRSGKKSKGGNQSVFESFNDKYKGHRSTTTLSPYLVPPECPSPVFILARGKMLLEMPTINGTQYFPFLPLDTFGHDLWTVNLPDDSRCITTEPCTVVVLDHSDLHLHAVLVRANKYLLEEQKRFLRDELKVKIFESWEEAEFEECAKCLLPLRVESFQLIVEEDEVSDALFFLKEGQLTVTRLVKPQLQKKKNKYILASPGGMTQPVASLPPYCLPYVSTSKPLRTFRHLQQTSLLPKEHVMQVASLQPGEFFGELGLMAHDPDVRPGENTVWTDKYWVDALSNRFQQSRDAVAAESSFLKELSRKSNARSLQDGTCRNDSSEEHGGALCARQLPNIDGDNSRRRSSKGTPLKNTRSGKGFETESNDKELEEGFEPCSKAPVSKEEEPIDQRYPLQTTPRKATVYAQLPSVLYRLSFQHCRQRIGGLVLTRLLEFMKGYPSHDDVYEQFEKQLKWTVYRDEFIAGILQQNRNTNKKEHLPKLKMK